MSYHTHDDLVLTVVGAISATQTSGIRMTCKRRATGEATTPDTNVKIWTIDKDNEKYEHVYAPDGFTVNSVGDITLTQTNLVRGLGLSGTALTAVTANQKSHIDGAEAGITASHFLHSKAAAVFDGTGSTGGLALEIGDGTATETRLQSDQGLANKAAYAFDATGSPIIYKADGSSFIPGAGAGSITGGDGIDFTASVVKVDLATDSGLQITTNQLEVKVTGAVSKSATGLDVDESALDYATNADALAGTAVDKPMNALRVKEAIDSSILSVGAITYHEDAVLKAVASNGTIFQAATDGIVFCMITSSGSGNGGLIQLLSDTNAAPVKLVGGAGQINAVGTYSFSHLVAKDEYYQLNTVNVDNNCNVTHGFRPLS